MLSSLVYVLGLSAFGIYQANALPSGPPLSTCNSLRPAHAPNSQNLNYLLSASSATFSPGQVLTSKHLQFILHSCICVTVYSACMCLFR